MALIHSPPGELGSTAANFALPGVDGKTYRLTDFTDSKALLIVFMCNHCPYVQAVDDRLNGLAKETAPKGVRVVGINSNDAVKYPDDGFEAMKKRALLKGYVFPYLRDESQEVARVYGAVCTPDFFLFQFAAPQKKFILRYRGRFDDNWKDEADVTQRDLARAIEVVLAGGAPSLGQKPSMGCSIKWK